jgi:hypothetical protein
MFRTRRAVQQCGLTEYEDMKNSDEPRVQEGNLLMKSKVQPSSKPSVLYGFRTSESINERKKSDEKGNKGGIYRQKTRLNQCTMW